MVRMHTALLVMLLASLSLSSAAPKCPPLTETTIRSAWEGWSDEDIRYFFLDLSDPQNGLLTVSWWRDSAFTMHFRLVQRQIGRGSAALFFQSVYRGNNDKAVVTAKGTACDSGGTIVADIQLILKHTLFSKDAHLTFHRRVSAKPGAVDLLRRIAEAAEKESRKYKYPTPGD